MGWPFCLNNLKGRYMNNQVKILLSIQGIAGGTLRKVGVKKIPFKRKIRNKGKELLVTKYRTVDDIQAVPASVSVKLTQDAYDYFISSECPPWFKDRKSWAVMKPGQRLEVHLKRMCDSRGGTGFTYSILED